MIILLCVVMAKSFNVLMLLRDKRILLASFLSILHLSQSKYDSFINFSLTRGMELTLFSYF